MDHLLSLKTTHDYIHTNGYDPTINCHTVYNSIKIRVSSHASYSSTSHRKNAGGPLGWGLLN